MSQDPSSASIKEMSRLMDKTDLNASTHDSSQPSGCEGAGPQCRKAEPTPGGENAVGDKTPVSLSQILTRPVYTSGLACSSVRPAAATLAPCTQREAMGNGTSGHHVTHSGGRTPQAVPPEDYSYLKSLVPELKGDIRERDLRIDQLEAETLHLRRQLKRKNEELNRVNREVHKLRSVLQEQQAALPGDILELLRDQNCLQAGQKKQGVSGESCIGSQTAEKIQIKKHEKDFRSKQLIKDAILDNDFLKHLEGSQVREMVDSMYPKEYPAGSWVILEKDVGSHLFVSAAGEMEVIKEGEVLGKITPGKAFGELAILYNCTRTASVKAVSAVQVWMLDRRVFQQVMMRTGLQRLEDNLNFLSSVPLLMNLNNDVLTKIADALEIDYYNPGTYIIRQGTKGDSFYIIRSGKVRITRKVSGKSEEEELRVLEKGNYFGEQALLREECRTANVIAVSPGVECLTMDRESFIQLIGDLSELREKDYGDDARGKHIMSASYKQDLEPGPLSEYAHIRLDDLDVIATLGVGGFGRVELVRFSQDRSMTFALKCLKKQHIVDTQQQEHIYSEKKIMMHVRSPFIARLYKTFRDSKYVYMMMEACLGGEVWTILRDRGWFDDNTARFYTACVVEALEYLHGKNIIYRDLKPENLLLDTRGYAKLVDFGFSKKLGSSSKTWTFCGTPEYVAPEIILNKGHDKAVDYWSIGILMYELLTGTPPFTASDPMKTYNIILKGIDTITFPAHVTRYAISLIKRLCRENPSERLGYQRAGISDIKKHRWFQSFDWEGLKTGALPPPIIPKIRSASDASNFDSYPRESEVPPDELSGWDLEF